MKLAQINPPLREGGNALANAGVQRIKKGDIPDTIKFIMKLSGIKRKDFRPLGSVGKTTTSGDIDLAVDISKVNIQAVHKKMEKALGPTNSVLNVGFNIGSYAVPIRGDEANGFVQVDLMFVEHLDWAEFSFFSPGDKSKYKGAIRSILLRAVAGSLNDPDFDHMEYSDQGELLVRMGRTIDPNKGFKRIFQHRPEKKGGGFLKSLKSVSLDKFKELFPEIPVRGDDAVISDPKRVVEILFSKGVTPKDVETAEQVIDLIEKFPKARADKANEIAKSAMSRLGRDLRIPAKFR